MRKMAIGSWLRARILKKQTYIHSETSSNRIRMLKLVLINQSEVQQELSVIILFMLPKKRLSTGSAACSFPRRLGDSN